MLPQDIVNRALDQIPGANPIGAFTDGTDESEAAQRIYGPTLRELLRAAHWDWARRRTNLILLGDATGQTSTVSTYVEQPWLYAYAWPNDCVAARWLAWNPQGASLGVPPGNIAIPLPAPPGINNLPGFWYGETPARFMTSSTDQYPSLPGPAPDFGSLPDYDTVEGTGPVNRRIILTNVPPTPIGPQLVYTYLALELELWDELFRQAMVGALTERLAMPLIKDPKERLAVRAQSIAIAKNALLEARTVSAREAGFPQSTSRNAEWIRARQTFGAYGGWGGLGFGGLGSEAGYLWCGWSGYAFGDGSVF